MTAPLQRLVHRRAGCAVNGCAADRGRRRTVNAKPLLECSPPRRPVARAPASLPSMPISASRSTTGFRRARLVQRAPPSANAGLGISRFGLGLRARGQPLRAGYAVDDRVVYFRVTANRLSGMPSMIQSRNSGRPRLSIGSWRSATSRSRSSYVAPSGNVDVLDVVAGVVRRRLAEVRKAGSARPPPRN